MLGIPSPKYHRLVTNNHSPDTGQCFFLHTTAAKGVDAYGVLQVTAAKSYSIQRTLPPGSFLIHTSEIETSPTTSRTTPTLCPTA